jgi:hypothetical protein
MDYLRDDRRANAPRMEMRTRRTDLKNFMGIT